MYGWRTDFKPDFFIAAIGLLLSEFGFRSGVADQDAAIHAALGRPAGRLDELSVPFIDDVEFAGVDVGAGLRLSALPAGAAGPAGVAVIPYVYGSAQTSFPVGPVDIELSASAGLDGGVALIFRPPEDLTVRTDMAGASQNEAAEFGIAVRYLRGAGNPLVLLGEPGAARLEVGGFGAMASVRASPRSRELSVEIEITDLVAVVKAPSGDGFLAKVLPPDGFTVTLDLAVGVSTVRGLYIRGNGGLEVELPLHFSVLGVFVIESLYVSVVVDDGRLRLAVALTAQLSLGPLQASVRRVGLAGQLEAADGGDGNLGPFDLGLGIRPPDGAGLTIDAAVVTGGGFVLFDEAKGLYAGILQLEIQGVVSIVAIGLITTKLPDGSPGFSLLVILTAEFSPIQLSFGFTLNGLGGLLGLNRTMDVDVLRAGVRSRILESILFPKDPVKNADKVIADLQSAFPTAPGRFVIGLMVKVGWGSPSLITLEIGIILELPAPIRIALIGRLTLALPEEEAIVQLRMDVLGILDFDRREVSIDATLFDSRIAAFTISGDMALRLNFGASPAFAMSAGGFHPRFPQPPDFPALNRMAIALADSENPRLRLEAYFATTPATLQFGARLDVFADADAGIFGHFTVSGYLTFDAIVEWVPPLRFVVDMTGGLTLKRNGEVLFGIEVWLSLSGTRPWRACGEATFHFLGKHRIPFDVTIGDPLAAVAAAVVDPLGELLAALEDRRNWTAHTPVEGPPLASVTVPDLGDDVVVHPLGSVSVAQQVLPLGLAMQRYKETGLAAEQRYDITGVRFGTSPVSLGDETREQFTAADYVNMSDDEKLSRPSFEPFLAGRSRIGFPASATGAAGLAAAGAGAVPVAAGVAVDRPDDAYETIVIDQIEPLAVPVAAYTPHAVVLGALTATAAAAHSPLRTTGTAGFAGPSLGIRLADQGYRVATVDSLGGIGAVHPTYADTAAARAGLAEPSMAQVVGSHEVR